MGGLCPSGEVLKSAGYPINHDMIIGMVRMARSVSIVMMEAIKG